MGSQMSLMPHSLQMQSYLHILWGGPPGPQPAPRPACRRPDPVDFVGQERVQGDPRGPGGPPHNLRRLYRFTKNYMALGFSLWTATFYNACPRGEKGFNSTTNTPARINPAPAAARAERLSPVSRYEVIQANTGSSIKIRAVRVEVV